MSGFYQPYLSSMAGTGQSPSTNPQDAQFPPRLPPTQLGDSGTPLPAPYQGIGYFANFSEPIMFQTPKTQGNRNRKKSAPGMEHVKHRRTRSGCYTCRSRRVKCDETHPICERCRKGKRDCVYPEPPTGKGPAGSGSSKDTPAPSQATSPDSSQEDEEEDTKLESILDEDEPYEESVSRSKSYLSLRRASTISAINLQRTSTRQSSETPSLEGPKSSSPSASTGTTASLPTPFQMSDSALQFSKPHPDWSHLSPDLQYYLGYFCENITHYNYCMVNDPDNFFQEILPSLAIQSGNDALLYAVVGFAAYHRTIQNPNGRIQEFLRYYNKSVTLLLSSLKRGEKQSTGILLTILQLATFEEYLGDWVSLMGHQKAALDILTRLFTPQTVMQSPASRMLLTWYVRFDVFVGMMAGFETTLPREWFSTAIEFYQEQVDKNPDHLGWRTEVQAATLRLISVDMSILYARGGRGEISGDAFTAEYGHLTNQLYEWKNKLDPVIQDPNYLITDFKHKEALEENDIVDPYKPGYLYDFPLFTTTILLAEWHSILVMHKSQEAFTLQREPSEELRGLALAICEIFEAIQLWPSTPNGTLTIIQPCLAIATLFLPRDARHHEWVRRKYALLESTG
ncbi:fungal-specific transcription factor domain-containing protein [Biscogniauxia mediterranea]|nr:fungal-specific transcription factor domain-containing protein [Biscogniauxia mediterranea]